MVKKKAKRSTITKKKVTIKKRTSSSIAYKRGKAAIRRLRSRN